MRWDLIGDKGLSYHLSIEARRTIYILLHRNKKCSFNGFISYSRVVKKNSLILF